MERTKKFLLCLMMVVMLLLIAPLGEFVELDLFGTKASAADIVKSGKCGDNVSYTLDSDGVLNISGKGEMYDYEPGILPSPFSANGGIKKVVLNDGVISIGENAFDYCYGLMEITIPNSVTSIGARSFFNCQSLTSVTIPNSVTSIGASSFFSCESLTSVTLPDSITDINEYTFYLCFGLKSINIPSSVISIKDYAFSHCSELTSIAIPYGVTSIETGAFFSCSRLADIIMSDSVKSIGIDAFSNCTGLTSITLPNGLTSIGAGAFSNCTGLTDIVLPSSVTSIKADTFNGCTGLTNIAITDSITSIGDRAFYGCTGLTDMTLPSSVTSIKAGTFNGCTGLTNITIPDSITSIGDRAFYGCTGLADITLPSSVTSIKSGTFNGCTGLTNITIPDSITSIGDRAFYGCTGLTNVSIPDSVTKIERDAFSNCTSLKSVTIPFSVTSIDSSALGYYYKKNKKYKVEDFTIKAVGHSYANYYAIEYGFKFEPIGETMVWQYECDSSKNEITLKGYSGWLVDIEIPSEIDGMPVTAIGEECFAGCDRLRKVAIPDSVTSIGNSAFLNCSGLKHIRLSKKLTSIGNIAFGGCYQITGVGLYEGLESIGAYAFSCCSMLVLDIPFSVTSIGEGAFYECTYARINVPCSLQNIGSDAFFHCREVDKRHHKVSTGYKPATCTHDGLSYLTTCSDCNKVFGKQFIIPATGHTYGTWEITKNPTYTTTGTQTRVCTACGAKQTETLAKLKTTAITKCTFSTLKPLVYTGKATKPTLTVKNGKTTLKAGTHYTVSYKNNTKIGKATVTIKGVEKNGYTGTKTLTFNILPGVTKSLKATQSTSSIKLTWSKVAGATGYRVYRHDGKKWVKLADTKNTTYTVSKLKAGTNYKYAVKAYTTVGKTVYWSASFAQISTATKPATPAIKVTAGKKQAAVSWQKITGATGYVVYYSTSQNGTYKKLAVVKGTSYTAKKLITGRAIYFKVAAYKTAGGKNIYSSFSAVKGVQVK